MVASGTGAKLALANGSPAAGPSRGGVARIRSGVQ